MTDHYDHITPAELRDFLLDVAKEAGALIPAYSMLVDGLCPECEGHIPMVCFYGPLTKDGEPYEGKVIDDRIEYFRSAQRSHDELAAPCTGRLNFVIEDDTGPTWHPTHESKGDQSTAEFLYEDGDMSLFSNEDGVCFWSPSDEWKPLD